MSLSPSLRNRVRRLEDARDAPGVLDLARALREARARWAGMTSAERVAEMARSLGTARSYLAEHGEPDWNDHTPAARLHQFYASKVRGHDMQRDRMADSSSVDTSAGAGSSAIAITSPPPIPTYDQGNP